MDLQMETKALWGRQAFFDEDWCGYRGQRGNGGRLCRTGQSCQYNCCWIMLDHPDTVLNQIVVAPLSKSYKLMRGIPITLCATAWTDHSNGKTWITVFCQGSCFVVSWSIIAWSVLTIFVIVVLMGYMGSGKSTIGKELATVLDYSFLDLDDYISDKH